MRSGAPRSSTSTARARSVRPRRIRRRMAPSRLWDSDDMTTQTAPAADPFDLDFDGETEFATPQTSGAADPSDPFAGLSAPLSADEEDGDDHAGASANPI